MLGSIHAETPLSDIMLEAEMCFCHAQTVPDVRVEGYDASAGPDDDQQSGGVKGVKEEVGAGLGRDIPSRKPARARQKPSKRCSVM